MNLKKISFLWSAWIIFRIFVPKNIMEQMTDKEIIDGLIARDNHVTEDFFFVKCRPLFYNIMRMVFGHEVECEELANAPNSLENWTVTWHVKTLYPACKGLLLGM